MLRYSIGGIFLKFGGKVSVFGIYFCEWCSILLFLCIIELFICCMMLWLCIKNLLVMFCKFVSVCLLLIVGGLLFRLLEVIISGYCSFCNSKCWSGFVGNIILILLRLGVILL